MHEMTKILIDRSTVEQALKALKMMGEKYGEYACDACDHADAAIDALRERLAQPEQCNHHFVRDEQAVNHYCCQKCGTVKVEQPEQEPVREPDYGQEEARRYAGDRNYWRNRYEALVEPLTEALAQPEQEPVGDEWTPCIKLPVIVHVRKQTYSLDTAQPQRTWVDLTDEELTLCHSLAVLSKKHDGTDPSFTKLLYQQIRIKLTEKNT